MEKQSVESDANRELIEVIKKVIKEVNRCTLFSDVCIKNVVERVSDLVDEFESIDSRIDDVRSERDYWEDECNMSQATISAQEEEISSLRSEIDDLKEQLSNKE